MSPPRQPADDMTQLDLEEVNAIANYDYEKAMFLTAARNELRNTNVQDATAHYEHQLEEYTKRLTARLDQTKAANEEKYQQECRQATDRLQVRMGELAATQKRGL
jgi:F0F1-type ATP synthase membrane subunit b/b'